MVIRGWAEGLARRHGIALYSPMLLVSMVIVVFTLLVFGGAFGRVVFSGDTANRSAQASGELAELYGSFAKLDQLLLQGQIIADLDSLENKAELIARLGEAELILNQNQSLRGLDEDAYRTLLHLIKIYRRPDSNLLSDSDLLFANLSQNLVIDARSMHAALRGMRQGLSLKETHLTGLLKQQDALHRRLSWALFWVMLVSLLPLICAVRLQRRLRESQSAQLVQQQRVDHLLCVMPGALLITSVDGRIAQCSEAMSSLLGYSRSQLLGEPIDKLIPPRLHQQYAVLSRNAIQLRDGELPVGRELLLRNKSGDELAVEMHLSYSDIIDGGGLLVCVRDVREQRAIYEKYRDSQQRFDLAAMASRDGLWDWNTLTGKIYMSPTWRNMMKWSEAETGDELERFWSCVPEQDRVGMKDAIKRFTRSGGYLFTYEHRVACGDGEVLDVVCRASVQRDSSGRILRMVGLHSDVTPFKQREREIRRLNRKLEDRVRLSSLQLEEALENADSANRAISAFLSVIGHEIRTPMNGVVGMAELLSKTPLSREQEMMLETLGRSSETLLTTLDSILDYAALEAGTLELQPQSVHLGSLIEGIADTAATEVARNHQKFYLHIDPLLPDELSLDPKRFKQMLMALIENAIKFSAHSRPHGEIELHVQFKGHEENKQIEFRIQDNGIGVASDIRSRLFRPFVQADTSRARRFSGTGLGLAIARHLARLMGGEIRLEQAEDWNTCFVVSIPVECEPHALSRASASQDRIIAMVKDPRLLHSLEYCLATRGARLQSIQTLDDYDALLESDKAESVPANTIVLSDDVSGEVRRQCERRGLRFLLLTARPINGREIAGDGLVYTNPLLPSVLLLALDRLKVA